MDTPHTHTHRQCCTCLHLLSLPAHVCLPCHVSSSPSFPSSFSSTEECPATPCHAFSLPHHCHHHRGEKAKAEAGGRNPVLFLQSGLSLQSLQVQGPKASKVPPCVPHAGVHAIAHACSVVYACLLCLDERTKLSRLSCSFWHRRR